MLLLISLSLCLGKHMAGGAGRDGDGRRIVISIAPEDIGSNQQLIASILTMEDSGLLIHRETCALCQLPVGFAYFLIHGLFPLM